MLDCWAGYRHLLHIQRDRQEPSRNGRVLCCVLKRDRRPSSPSADRRHSHCWKFERSRAVDRFTRQLLDDHLQGHIQPRLGVLLNRVNFLCNHRSGQWHGVHVQCFRVERFERAERIVHFKFRSSCHCPGSAVCGVGNECHERVRNDRVVRAFRWWFGDHQVHGHVQPGSTDMPDQRKRVCRVRSLGWHHLFILGDCGERVRVEPLCPLAVGGRRLLIEYLWTRRNIEWSESDRVLVCANSRSSAHHLRRRRNGQRSGVGRDVLHQKFGTQVQCLRLLKLVRDPEPHCRRHLHIRRVAIRGGNCHLELRHSSVPGPRDSDWGHRDCSIGNVHRCVVDPGLERRCAVGHLSGEVDSWFVQLHDDHIVMRGERSRFGNCLYLHRYCLHECRQ